MKLLLFDVDGTLVLTGGAGVRAMTRAFQEVWGVPDAFRRVAMAGGRSSASACLSRAFSFSPGIFRRAGTVAMNSTRR